MLQKMERMHGVRIWYAFLLLTVIFLLLSGCGKVQGKQKNIMQENRQNAAQPLDVWFFACSEDADSILLKTGDVDILIDTGIEEDGKDFLEKLETLGVDDIELLILTHPDKDHIGGAPMLLETFQVERLIQTSCVKGSELQEEMNQKLEDNPGMEQVEVLQKKETVEFGELKLTVYPPKETEYKNSNNYSIGVLAEFEGKSFFFAGDAKKKRMEELLEEKLPDVDVYKAAHHGRDNGASVELIMRLKPEYAVITAEKPEEETKLALEALGADIYCTYEKDIHFFVKDGVLDVR